MAIQKNISKNVAPVKVSDLPTSRSITKAVTSATKPATTNPADSADGNGATKKPRAPKGPSLTWNVDRDRALVKAIKSGVVLKSALALHLASDPAFDDVDQGAFSANKIGSRIKTLRKLSEEAGKGGLVATFDSVQREPRTGGGRAATQIDLDALEAMDVS